MYLDAASRIEGNEVPDVRWSGPADRLDILGPWRDWRPSRIGHHGLACCNVALEWLAGTDRSMLAGSTVVSGPRWLRATYRWGPSAYPVRWCEAVRRKTLDCGSLSALADEVFRRRGLRSMRVQGVQRFTDDAAAHWQRTWTDAGVSADWIGEGLIYHEFCAILIGKNEVKIWDASSGWWVEPENTDGYGSLAAVRLAANGRPGVLRWGRHWLEPGEWQIL